MSDPAFGVFPNFLARSLVVSAPVRLIVVLVKVGVTLGKLLGKVAGQRLRPISTFQRIRLDDFHTVGGEDLLSLRAGVCRQAEGHLVASRSANHAIRDSGIPAAGIENCLACT